MLILNQRDAICLELDTNVVEKVKLLWTWLEGELSFAFSSSKTLSSSYSSSSSPSPLGA